MKGRLGSKCSHTFAGREGGWEGGKGYEGSFHSKGKKTVSLFDSAVSNVGEVITSGARVGREPGSEVAAGMPGGPEEVGVRGHRCCPEPPVLMNTSE